MLFDCIAPSTLIYLAYQYFSFECTVPDEGYSRNVPCTLNLIFTFLLNYMCKYVWRLLGIWCFIYVGTGILELRACHLRVQCLFVINTVF